MEIFNQLGAQIEKLWRDKNYVEDVFPKIAADALREADLPAKIAAWEIAAWTLGQDMLPEQRGMRAAFGQPAITLYNSPRFHIDIYFWLEGTTTVHQHSFCGAFQVLLGSSIHSHYDFEEQERVNFHTAMGALDLHNVELLRVGDVRRIVAGSDFIHSLFHLDFPSATIVVRTTRIPLYLPQFDYYHPGLAVDPFFEDPTLTKKQQTVGMLLRVNHPDAPAMIENLFETSDFQTSYYLLSAVRNHLQNDQLARTFKITPAQLLFERLFEIVRRRHGSLAEILSAVYAEQDRKSEIINRRGYVSDAGLRFFLALLLNVEGKERILSLIEEKEPNADPVETVLDWTLDLSNTKVLNSTQPNAVGIVDFNDDYLFALEGLLKNKSVEQIQRDAFEQYPRDYAAALETRIPACVEKLQSSALFKSLLSK